MNFPCRKASSSLTSNKNNFIDQLVFSQKMKFIVMLMIENYILVHITESEKFDYFKRDPLLISVVGTPDFLGMKLTNDLSWLF